MVYPNDVPYFTLFPRPVTLPRGAAIDSNNPGSVKGGYGNLIFLYTTSVDETLNHLNHPDNFFLKRTDYKSYFYNVLYSGKLRSKKYYIRDTKIRKELYASIRRSSKGVMPVNALTLEGYSKNTVYELSRYLQIYHGIMDKYDITSRVITYWDYLFKIINDPTLNGFKQKFLIIDAKNYSNAFNGSIKERLSNPLFMIYYTMLRYPDILSKYNQDIFIFYEKRCIRINPSQVQRGKTSTKFRQLLSMVMPGREVDINNATSIDAIAREEKAEALKASVDKSFNFTGEDEGETFTADDLVPDEVKALRNNSTQKQSATATVQKSGDTSTSEEDEKDNAIINDIWKQAILDNNKKSAASTARDAQIKEAQKKIPIGNTDIEHLQKKETTHIPIMEKDVSKAVTTTNKNMHTITFKNFEKTYNDEVFPKDMVNAFAALNDKSLPMTIIKYDVKDTSDELNYKDTYTVVLEDSNRQRHTISVDIPKFIDDRFMWIGGAKKIILYQSFLMPVVKSGPDKVQIVTNYNKMFIERYGTKSITSLERLNKIIASNETISSSFESGRGYELNAEYSTTVEYDELSKRFIRFKHGDTKIFFSQEEAINEADKVGITIGDNEIFIGFKGKVGIMIDQNTQKTSDNKTIVDIIIQSFSDEVREDFEKVKAPKRLMYSVATTMQQKVALGLLLGFWEGLSSVLNALKLDYRLEAKTPKTLKSDESMLKFKDCYLVYKESIAQSLIMNGFRIIDTHMYNIADFETKDPYMDYLLKVYGKRSISNALMNVYEFMIDPITLEILQDKKLPETLVPLCVYANSLLSDSQFKPDYDQHQCRIRSSEIIPAILYDSIAKQYIQYKNSNGKKKLSIPKDIVIKKLLELKTVEEFSTLNPALELERTHAVLYKGWRGINSDRTYTQDKRVFDNSMIGVIGPTTSPDGEVGVHKTLSMEPRVTSARGYIDVADDLKKADLKDVNLFGPADMLIPMAVTRDDPTRTGHAMKQSCHVIPVAKSSPVLISNGAEEIARFNLSSDFVVNAKMDGEVVEVNPALNLIICKYKDGTHQAINLQPKIVKNGGGGFYLSNHLITNLKPGDKFKKDDMLAWHKDFFKSGTYTGNRMNIGTLVKVAIMSNYNTYNDSTVITDKMSREMATEMVFNRQVVVGKNANVDFIASVGDHIEVGSSLIQFDTSFEDSELNQLLNTLSENLKQGVAENSKNNIQSKHAGIVEDIKMYSTVDLEELSPSLQKIFGTYYKKISDKKKLLSKYDNNDSIVKCGMLVDESTGKISPNKYGVLKGQKVEDSVLIEFYIKHEEHLEIGSKIAYFSGLKTTIGEIIPVGYEPYSEFRKDEEVSSFIASNSILKRMVPSVLLTSLGNKCLIELKRSLEKIYNETREDGAAKTKMTALIYKFFNTIDKTKENTAKYKAMFEPMAPAAFRKWFKGFFADPDAYLVLDIIDYERMITMDDIEKTAAILGVPLFEYVYTPHTTMNKGKVVRTRTKVPVGYIHIKRTQQTIAKKNGISISSDVRSSLTGQVTGADKNGRESDLENSMLVAIGLTNTLKELNGPRADDMTAKREMLSDIARQGYVRYEDLTYDVSNKATLNTVDVYFMGMSLVTDLVTKGLMTKSTLKQEL